MILMADPKDPYSAASTFAVDQPGRGVVSDDADAKGQNPRGFETESQAQRADGVEDLGEQQYAGQAHPPADDVNNDAEDE